MGNGPLSGLISSEGRDSWKMDHCWACYQQGKTMGNDHSQAFPSVLQDNGNMDHSQACFLLAG